MAIAIQLSKVNIIGIYITELHVCFNSWMLDHTCYSDTVSSGQQHLRDYYCVQVLVKNFDPHGKRQIRADQCAWYCINFVIDSIIGIPLVWVFLTLISWFAMKFDYAALKQRSPGFARNVVQP